MLMSGSPTSSNRGLSAAEVAERLGVTAATVYAYASRGSLTKVGSDGRHSLYDAGEVEALAQRSRPRSGRRTSAAVDVTIGTTVSEIGDGWIRYRDQDLLGLLNRPFEEVTALLWGVDTPERTTSSSERHRHLVANAAVASSAMTIDTSLWPRLVAAAAAVGATPGEGWEVLDALVASTGPESGARRRTSDIIDGATADLHRPIAHRLWTRLSPQSPTRARVAVLDMVLVALAEHELATSTLAVRVAASTGAPAAASVVAGLAALSGSRHGGAPAGVHRALLAIASGVEPEADDRAAGLGHPVHVSGDPRYGALIGSVASIASAKQRRTIDTFTALPERQSTAARPNVDAAVGALGYVMGAPVGATEAIFAIARTAGWLAHAYEEADEQPLRFRGRTTFRRPRAPGFPG